MELTILGSGTYQPELKRHCSSYLLRIGKQNLVFDFGRGVLDQLMKVGVNYYDIDTIFLTHHHADHYSELGSLLHIALVEPEIARLRKKDLIIYGPRGMKKAINYLIKAFGLEKHKPPYKIEIKELKSGSQIKGKGWLVKGYKIKHSRDRECLAYRIKSKNKVLAYSGDTEKCLNLIKTCKNADLAVIEADYPQKLLKGGHLSAGDAAQIAQEAKVKKLVLTHIDPYYLKKFDVKGEAKKFYKGPIVIAKDLMKIKI